MLDTVNVVVRPVKVFQRHEKQTLIEKIDVRRGYGPSAAADAKEIHMNMHVF